MQCPLCNAELRAGKRREEPEKTLVQYLCVNPRCRNYKKQVAEKAIPKERSQGGQTSPMR